MLHIALGEELKQQLKKQATRLGLSLNAYIRMILIETIDKKNKEEY